MSDTSQTSAATPKTGGKCNRQTYSTEKPEKIKRGKCTCPICLDTIVEATKTKKVDDAILCDGSCESWMHRRCAGLSESHFKIYVNSDISFIVLIVNWPTKLTKLNHLKPPYNLCKKA